MIQLIALTVLGALLITSLYSFLRAGRRTEGSSGAIVEAKQALNALQGGLLPPALVARIFAKDDLEYVVSETPKGIQELFLRERKAIALGWVSGVQERVLSLRRFHLGSARFHAGLSFQTELGLAVRFSALLFACRTLQLLLYVRGPYAAPRMVGSTVAAAARICEVSAVSLGFLAPAYATSAGERATRIGRA